MPSLLGFETHIAHSWIGLNRATDPMKVTSPAGESIIVDVVRVPSHVELVIAGVLHCDSLAI